MWILCGAYDVSTSEDMCIKPYRGDLFFELPYFGLLVNGCHVMSVCTMTVLVGLTLSSHLLACFRTLYLSFLIAPYIPG